LNGKILTFILNHHIFGVDITVVKEINRNVEYTPVPQANEHIAGLFNMRGQIVTLMDLEKLFGYHQNHKSLKTSCLILKPEAGETDIVGFLIDKPGDVVDIKEEWCELPPANVSSLEGKYLRELVKLDDKLVMILDVQKIIQVQ